MKRPFRDLPVTRRQLLRMAAFGAASASSSGWIEALAGDAARDPARKRSCILLWMSGGPSQTDTFDLKPGHANGGPFKAIDTAAPGVKISEHLPKLAAADERRRPDPLDEDEGGRPRPRHLPPADRLHADRADPVPVARLPGGEGAGGPGARAAGVRQHQPPPILQRRGLRAGLPRPRVRPADRRRGQLRRRGRRRQPVAEGPGPDGAGRHRPPADRRPARPARGRAVAVPRRPAERGRLQPPDRLREGGDDDAFRGGPGVRPRGRAGPAPRRLRPEHLRPGLPAGPPPRRAGGPFRRGLAQRRRRWRARLGYASG